MDEVTKKKLKEAGLEETTIELLSRNLKQLPDLATAMQITAGEVENDDQRAILLDAVDKLPDNQNG